jgi:nucleotide-binding universal stress UspA family protein
MAFKQILVHADDTPGCEARLQAALALAAACGAQVAALYLVAEPFLRASVGRHLPEGFVREHLAALEQAADARLAELAALAAAKGQTLETRRATGMLDRLPILLARQGRAADLTVVGPAGGDGGGGDEALLAEAAFMDTGRPALVVPPDWAGTLPPARALVAWDGSREAARAAGDAIPLLRHAGDVVVLVVDAHAAGPRFGDEPGAGLAAFLARHEVKARIKHVAGIAGGPGPTILAQAQEERADLLVMGGYGHSRVREMLFGGTTRHILDQTTAPVLLAH